MKHIPRKRFGQHFLTDTGILDAIVRAIDPRPDEILVEIGPGMGAMTDPVVERCERLTVGLDQCGRPVYTPPVASLGHDSHQETPRSAAPVAGGRIRQGEAT